MSAVDLEKMLLMLDPKWEFPLGESGAILQPDLQQKRFRKVERTCGDICLPAARMVFLGPRTGIPEMCVEPQ